VTLNTIFSVALESYFLSKIKFQVVRVLQHFTLNAGDNRKINLKETRGIYRLRKWMSSPRHHDGVS